MKLRNYTYFNCAYLFSATLLAEAGTVDQWNCDSGDLNGSPERGLGQKTREECYEAAMAAGANGAITSANCPSTCTCYAEFGVTQRWNGAAWYGCIFYPGKKFEQDHHVEYFYDHVFKIHL